MRRNIFIPCALLLASLAAAFALCACENRKTKSAYDLYVDSYLESNGTSDGVLSEEEWLDSLKGDTGADGSSAYEIYKQYTHDDPVLSEEEWLDSLKGDTGIAIKQVDIECGCIVITFSDGSVHRIEDAYPEAGHHWNDGTMTTLPTCKTAGVKTLECTECTATKTVPVDSDPDKHVYVKYETDTKSHWQTCSLCGNTVKNDHDFGDREESNPEGYPCKDCGYLDSYANYAYRVSFVCSEGVSIRVYQTQDYENGGINSFTAFSRDSGTGALTKSGEGQVNFEIIFPEGHGLDGDIEIDVPEHCKSLKGYEDTGKTNVWRITKITGDLTVTIRSKLYRTLYNFASVIEKSENKIKFKWDTDFGFDRATVNVQIDGAKTSYAIDTTSNTWDYPEFPDDKKIVFDFTFHSGEKTATQSVSRYYHSDKETVPFARIEIDTKDNILPSCDKVAPPPGVHGFEHYQQ